MSFPSLDSIVGHQEIISRLKCSVRDARLAHAYLFFGPDGVGKATTVRSLVQFLFCQNSKEQGEEGVRTSCGQCSSCKRMASGTHPDYLYVGVKEGKTAISVDQVRNLTYSLALTPMEAGWKAALVDDAALLNEQSANALLKTLEEPVPNTLIVLVTHRPGALLPTLLSRCQKMQFGRLSSEEVMRILADLVQQDQNILKRAAHHAEGGVARALALCHDKQFVMERNLRKDLESVHSDRLGVICEKALYWSHVDRFFVAMTLLEKWLREQVHGTCSQPVGERWALFSLEVSGLSVRSGRYHLNRRLVWERILIRLARLKSRSQELGTEKCSIQ